jgi:tungstate transport system ATP-binding protein
VFDAVPPETARLWPVVLDSVRVAAGGRPVIEGLSLRLEPGGITALMGPNGAGKSLTLRLAAGLLAPAGGVVRWGGETVPPRGAVALVFQRPVLLRRSAAANIVHALALAGVPRRARPARCAELLALGGLAPLADRPARALSGGEAQRLALVRALAAAPRLLLLDEPTASLDPAATAAIEALVRRIAEGGTTVLIVTHDTGQARRLADRALFLHRGRVVEQAAAADLLDRPQSAEAQAYLAGQLLL